MEIKTEFLTNEAIKSKTPQWLTNIFRATLIITTVVSFWVSGTSIIQEASKTEVVLVLKCFDMFVWLVCRGSGEVKKY